MYLRQLFEEPRTAVMAFGRMNPPTIGHKKLVDKIKSYNGDHYVFLSQSQKPKTDPLDFTEKLRYAKFFFPGVTIGHPEVKTIIQALSKISSLGYKNLIYVAGSDRVQAFEELINKYNNQPDKSGNIAYAFDNIQVVSAGERDPDADGAEGMSASKMRQAAADGDMESFKQGVPQPELADEMFKAVRKGMGLMELEPAESVEESFGVGKWFKTTFNNDPYFRAWYRLYKKDPEEAEEKFPSKHEKFLAQVEEDASEKEEKKMKKVKEGNLVLDPGRLRSHIISLIADKIAATDDIDQLAEWLRLIVGKELKARGSRYQISSEDIVEAINMKMSDIVKEENKTPPTKVKPVREPFPQMPQIPTEPVSGENGEIIKPTKNGGVSLGNAAGTFIWDKAGKPSMYITPSMAGMKQVHNMKTGNFTVDYSFKGLNIKQEYDKDGNSIGGTDTQYSMGGVTVKQDKQGNRSGTHQMGTKTVNFDPNKPFDPSKAG
jgi:hypothetical protein